MYTEPEDPIVGASLTDEDQLMKRISGFENPIQK
jgi:hypothetical protein